MVAPVVDGEAGARLRREFDEKDPLGSRSKGCTRNGHPPQCDQPRLVRKPPIHLFFPSFSRCACGGKGREFSFFFPRQPRA